MKDNDNDIDEADARRVLGEGDGEENDSGSEEEPMPWGSRPVMDPESITLSDLDKITKSEFGQKDLTDYIVPVRDALAKRSAAKKDNIPKYFLNWGKMKVPQRLKFINLAYRLEKSERLGVIAAVKNSRDKEDAIESKRSATAPATANEKLRMLILRASPGHQMMFQSTLGLYLSRAELEDQKKYTKVDAEAGDVAWEAIREAFNDYDYEPGNPVIGGEDDNGDEHPLAHCSQQQFVRSREMDPQSYRTCSKAQAQECYRSLKAPLTKALAGYNASGRHDGDFTTQDGTNEWALFCDGLSWLEMACFVLETKQDIGAISKIHSTEWYDADSGFDESELSSARRGLLKRHYDSMRAQSDADLGNTTGSSSGAMFSVSAARSGSGKPRRGKGNNDDSTSGTVQALNGVLQRIAGGGSEMSGDKRLEMLKFIMTNPLAPNATEMQTKAYDQLCKLVINSD